VKESDNRYFINIGDRYVSGAKLFDISDIPTRTLCQVISHLISDRIIVYSMDGEGRGGRVVSVNDAACSCTGYSREELLRMNIDDVLSPEGSDGSLPLEIKDDGIGGFSSRLKRADGVDIPVDVRVVSIDEGEKLIYMAIIWEKSDPMNSKEETEGNSDLNRAAFMASHDPIMVSNLKDGKIIDVNDAFTPISGWTREEVIGRTTMDIDLWCRIDDRKAYVKELERRGKVRDFQTHLKDRNGDEHPVSLSASIVTVGNERYIVTICRDLKGTWELTRLKDLAFQTLEKDDSMILWIDMEGKVYYVNETVTGYLGYTKKSKLINFLKEVKEKGSTSVETVMKRPDGRTFPAEAYLNHLKLDGEEIIFAFVRDISERRRMENLLAKSRMFERGLIDSTLDSLLLINREGVILTCNAVAAERSFPTTLQGGGGNGLNTCSPQGRIFKRNIQETISFSAHTFTPSRTWRMRWNTSRSSPRISRT